MEKTIIKPIIKVGNSAGVILPREWLSGKAKIELIETPINLKKDIFEILDDYLEDILGIYLVGSYARKDETKDSDVDVLVITNNTHKKIEKGKYSIILTTKELVENALENNVLLILPMIKESKALLNSLLIESYKDTILTKNNLNWYIETTKSALDINKLLIELDKQSTNTNDDVAYSLVLRLRGAYIIDCIINKKEWSNKKLLSLIKNISGSLKAYEGYVRVKKNMPAKEDLPVEEAEKLHDYIAKIVEKHEKWITKRK